MADVDDADLESSELSPAIMSETGNFKKSVRFPEQLVAEVPFVKTFHPLESQQIYARVGQALVIQATPPVVHFPGCEPGQRHTQKLSILNRSGHPTRVHILNPQTPFFRIHFDKRGSLPAGVSEDITVEFVPTEWRYYQDSIRVHAEGENLLIPLHAYPIMNPDRIFPQRVFMGNCPLSESISKTIFFENVSPMAFEFELTVLSPSIEFTVHPLRGRIEGQSRSPVTLTFAPARRSTAHFELLVAVSQFGLEPFLCHVTASSYDVPVVDEQTYDKYSTLNATKTLLPNGVFLSSSVPRATMKVVNKMEKLTGTKKLMISSKPEENPSSPTQQQIARDSNRLNHYLRTILSKGGISIPDDLSPPSPLAADPDAAASTFDTSKLTLRIPSSAGDLDSTDLQSTGIEYDSDGEPIKRQRPTIRMPKKGGTYVVDGVRFPHVINTVSVRSALNQDPKKSGMKALKKMMILQQRQQAADAKAMLAAAAADPEIQAQLKSRGMSLESERFDFSVRAHDSAHFMGSTREMRAMVFQSYCREREEYEKALLLKASKNRIGQKLLTQAQQQQIRLIWARQERDEKANERRAQLKRTRLRLENRAVPHLAACVPAQTVAGVFCTASLQTPSPSDPFPPVVKSASSAETSSLDGPSATASALTAAVTAAAAEPKPDFDVFKNDAWRMRKQVLSRFNRAIASLLLDRRIGERIDAVVESLKGRGFGAKAEGSTQKARPPPPSARQVANESRPLPAWFTLTDERISPFRMPVAANATQIRREQTLAPWPQFNDLTLAEAPVADEWRLCGYRRAVTLPVSAHFPAELDRKLRSGAIEEDATRMSRGPVATLVAPEKAASLAATATAAGISTAAATALAAAAEAPTGKKKLKRGEAPPEPAPVTIGALLIGINGQPPEALPEHLLLTPATDPLLFLRSEPQLQARQVSLPGDEISPQSLFTSVDNFARSVPTRVHCPMASFFTEKLGSAPPTLRQYPLIVERWRARLDNPFLPTCVSALKALEPRSQCMQVELHQHDTYSDSESDDDEEKLAFKPLLPTAELSRSLFSGAAEMTGMVPEWSPLQSLPAAAVSAIGGAGAKPAAGAIQPQAASLRRTPYEEADEELRERLAKQHIETVQHVAAQLTRWNDKVTEPRLKSQPLIM